MYTLCWRTIQSVSSHKLMCKRIIYCSNLKMRRTNEANKSWISGYGQDVLCFSRWRTSGKRWSFHFNELSLSLLHLFMYHRHLSAVKGRMTIMITYSLLENIGTWRLSGAATRTNNSSDSIAKLFLAVNSNPVFFCSCWRSFINKYLATSIRVGEWNRSRFFLVYLLFFSEFYANILQG